MKKQEKIIISFTIFILISLQIHAQKTDNNVDTTWFQVSGVCNMCKARIENAVLIKGVKYAEWEKESQLLTVIYKTGKVSQEELEQAVTEAGHDTENYKANEETYEKLPDCCAYRDGVHVH